MSEALLRLATVLSITSLSRGETYRRMAEGDFPTPVQLSSRRVAWVKSEVLAWLDHQIALRDQQKESEHAHH